MQHMEEKRCRHCTMPRHCTYNNQVPFITAPQKRFLGLKFGETILFLKINMETKNFWKQILGGKIWGANSFGVKFGAKWGANSLGANFLGRKI